MSDAAARLYLITPAIDDPATFIPAIEAALGAGEVACLLLRAAARDARATTAIAKALAPLVQTRGTAFLVAGDTRLASYADADGVHMDDAGDELLAAVRSCKPARIVGAGGLTSRDDAMAAGESGVDYVMFGEPADDGSVASFDDRFARIGWWAEIFQVPCVAYAGSLDEVEAFATVGAEFVALGDAVWADPRGPAAAVADAIDALAAGSLRFATAQAERIG